MKELAELNVRYNNLNKEVFLNSQNEPTEFELPNNINLPLRAKHEVDELRVNFG